MSFSFLIRLGYWIELFRRVVEHRVRFRFFFDVAMLSGFWVRSEWFSIVIHFDCFIVWLLENIVLLGLRVNEILNSLIIIHQVKVLFLRFLKTDSGIDWWCSFYITFWRIYNSSSLLIIRILLAYIWVPRFNWNDSIWGWCKQLVPVFMHVIGRCKFFVINSFEILNLWGSCLFFLTFSTF